MTDPRRAPRPDLSPLPSGYDRLLERAMAELERDERVRAAWLHGSVARGDADAVSDLDVIVAVTDDGVEEFGAGWRDRLDRITPTLMARRVPGPGGSWLSIAPDCLRFDFWVERCEQVPGSPVRDRRVLFDRDGLTGSVPAPEPPGPPSEDKLNRLRDWYAVGRAMAERADPLLEIEVIHTLRWILYDAYVETNQPAPKLGVKQWSAKLRPDQLRIMEALPTRGDPAPIVEALDQVLGAPTRPTPTPALGRVVFPPEGTIRLLSLSELTAEERRRHLAEELLALHIYVTVVVHRQDWLLGIDGIHLHRKLLYELCLEENGRPTAASPADWSGRLTPGQRDELLSLPTGGPSRDGVIDAFASVRQAFVRRGRALLGDDWPDEMEQAVVAHVEAFIT